MNEIDKRRAIGFAFTNNVELAYTFAFIGAAFGWGGFLYE